MHVGILQLDIFIPESRTLKDKRRVVRSLKDRIAQSHNVSVAEVSRLDEYQRSIIGIAMIGNDKRYIEGGLSRIVDLVRMNGNINLLDYKLEML
ncbi:MAG: hypothetical protein KatS3mg104_1763 [Phycisphaerae bacterium]|jgi:uncharacterized protein YlxP (DUF503 family)|nr:MAG: hypothetical protein KatS3mg104_1763 [Phycisphaerae bacterium]